MGFVAAGLLAAQAQGAVVAEYANDFNAGSAALVGTANNLGFGGWSVGGTTSTVAVRGLPAPASDAAHAHVGAGFLGEFGGNDRLTLALDGLPEGKLMVAIAFDLYLLRSWDGIDSQYSGDDIFGFGYNGSTLLEASFSNGAQKQSYCPGGVSPCDATWGSDGELKNELGFGFGIWTEEDEQGWKPQSLVVRFPDFTMNPFEYDGDSITFDFFSRGLQIRSQQLPDGYDAQGTTLPFVDESWAIDNLRITMWQPDPPAGELTPAAEIPEPGVLALTLAGMAALWVGRRRVAPTPAVAPA